MKTKFTLVVALMLAATISTKAQQQGYQRKTVEERVQSAMQKISDPLKLGKDEQDKTTTVLTDFYTQQDKMRQDARASGTRPDRSVIEKMANDRDEKLKGIFTEDQYKKFKDEVEPSMRPQRQTNGQGTGNS
ncbi:MAG: hypothetical protein M3015_06860 [Bacteroidota bacterium]|nr:hypothetical protein [Bacteroidota bacterium]